MPSTNLTFADAAAHRRWLETQCAPLPKGFRVGTARFDFTPVEAPKPARMTLTLVALDAPTPDFAAVFTKNAFPGAPVIVGRSRVAAGGALGALLINNKVSNVCAPGGVADSERLCAGAAAALGIAPEQVLPCSTGVIGWKLPVEAMLAALPAAAASLDAASALPAAEGIVTTDLYPKARRAALRSGATIVAFAKGAGMIEPNLATMLAFVLTDAAVPRAALREMLPRAVAESFNAISIDGDTSTSDTVALVAGGRVAQPDLGEFEDALRRVCRDLAEDIVRNGEGVRHVIRVSVSGAPSFESARALGKAVVNAPLFKCAVAGNDPNVGRLVQAVGKFAGAGGFEAAGCAAPDLSRLRATLGGIEIFAAGAFRLDPAKEERLARHMRDAELYASRPDASGFYAPPARFPAHERAVEVGLELFAGDASATVTGADLTHEYVCENADYRS